jgi:hypothetical protein
LLSGGYKKEGTPAIQTVGKNIATNNPAGTAASIKA